MATSARIDELRKRFDENPRRYFAPLANEYRKAGDLEQAIFICQEYLPQQPGHMSGHIVYGQALYEQNRPEEAKAVFETALALDPENLIALRHLGDIARQADDMASARGWYQRVLEADPRNEEITQIMLSLAASADPAPSMPDAIPEPEVELAPDPVAQASEQRGEFHIEKSEEVHLTESTEIAVSSAPEVSGEPSSASPTGSFADDDALRPVSPHAPKDADLLDLDDFDLGGTPPREGLSSPPGTETAIEGADAASAPAAFGIELPSMVEEDEAIETDAAAGGAGEREEALLRDEPAESFEADPFAIAATLEDPAPEPTIELATDVRLGLVDDQIAPARNSVGANGDDGLAIDVPDAPGLSMDDSDRAVESIEGLETFEPGVFIAADVAAQSLPIEPFIETPFGSTELDTAEAFVTETMAELYLQQGHLESALEIYRKLVAQRPDDTSLAARMRVIEDGMFGERPEPIEAPVAARPFGGPTIREYLSGLARRIPSHLESTVGESPASGSGDAFDTRLEDTLGATLDGTVDLTGEPSAPLMLEEEAGVSLEEPGSPVATPPPSSSETVTGSLGALFSEADATASGLDADTSTARRSEALPLAGAPAHRAPNELSLDHVFKGTSMPRGAVDGNGFSFDQFFSDEAAEGLTPSATEQTTSGPDGSDDIAQFNAWLNGLKKT